jgi:hypothetical protein
MRKSESVAKKAKGSTKSAVAAATVAIKKKYYAKKTVQKRLDLLQKYDELVQSRKLDTFLTKKRKRVASKGRRYIPKERK